MSAGSSPRSARLAPAAQAIRARVTVSRPTDAQTYLGGPSSPSDRATLNRASTATADRKQRLAFIRHSRQALVAIPSSGLGDATRAVVADAGLGEEAAMRMVIALGGQALLWRSGPMTTEVLARNARIAARAIAPLAAEHSIVVVHGNGPQAGWPASQAGSCPGAEPYPLDVLDAGQQGMIGYLIQKELRNLLPPQTPVATVLTMITVDPDDPAFARPSTFVGPVYQQDASDILAAKRGWTFRRDGTAWRRVVPSPEPRQILEIKPITWLLQHGAVVICAGGGGMPSVRPTLSRGVVAADTESIIDKDLASEMLAEDIG